MARPNNSPVRETTGSFDFVRFFILLSMACAMVLLGIVVKMTLLAPKAAPVVNPASIIQATEKPGSQVANSKKKSDASRSAHSKSKRNRRGASRTEQNASTMNVKDDSTPVFQSNSADSTLVKSLQRGDQVRSGGLEIIDPRGSWTLIEKSGRSGFVPTEMLERESSTKQATN